MTSRTLSKEKIVAAAVQIINNQESLTFTRLSKLLGTRSQAIYNYFPDVMAIKGAVAADFYNQLSQRLRVDLLGMSGKECNKGLCQCQCSIFFESFFSSSRNFKYSCE